MTSATTITEEMIEFSNERTRSETSESIVGQVPRLNPFECCAWLQNAIDEIDQLKRLPDGWDSYSAISPSQHLLTSGVNLLISLCCGAQIPRPETAPTPGGGVQFSWSRASRYLEIEIVGERAATYLYEDCDNSQVIEGELFLQESLVDVLNMIVHVSEG